MERFTGGEEASPKGVGDTTDFWPHYFYTTLRHNVAFEGGTVLGAFSHRQLGFHQSRITFPPTLSLLRGSYALGQKVGRSVGDPCIRVFQLMTSFSGLRRNAPAPACVGKFILWYWARRQIRRQILQPNNPVDSYGHSEALLQAAIRSKIRNGSAATATGSFLLGTAGVHQIIMKFSQLHRKMHQN